MNSWQEMAKCPACKTECIRAGLANHIYGKAKNELWNYTLGLSKDIKHFNYYKNNVEIKEVKLFKVNLNIKK